MEKQIQDTSEEDFDIYASPIENQIGKKQKAAVVALSVFAVIIMAVWAVRFQESIVSPLQPKTEQLANSNSQTSEEAQRSSDTDGDGLNDWDELNLYKTSPFLEDSDSDQINDKAEIDAGKDPNCPEGRTCNTAITTSDTTTTASSAVPNLYSDQTLTQVQNSTEQSSQKIGTEDKNYLNQLFSDNMDAATLRQLMIDQGMKKADLDKISDEQLMKSFKEVLKK